MIALSDLSAIECGMRFDRKLRHLMVERDIGQEALAKAAGVSQSSISRWLSGSHLPQIDAASRIAREMGVSLDWLADDEAEWPPPAPIYSAPPRPVGSIRYPEPPATAEPTRKPARRK